MLENAEAPIKPPQTSILEIAFTVATGVTVMVIPELVIVVGLAQFELDVILQLNTSPSVSAAGVYVEF